MLALLVAVLIFCIVTVLLWSALSHGLPGGYRAFRRTAARLAKPIATRFGTRIRGSRHVVRVQPYFPVLLIAVAGFVLIFWAGDAFLDLVEELQRESHTLQMVDQGVYDLLKQQRTAGLTQFFTFFTILGAPVTLAVITVAMAVYLLIQGRRRWVAYLVLTTVAGSALNVALKHFFVRPRPDLALALRDAQGHSFPSGHAMGSIVVFGALAYLAIRGLKDWRAASGVLAVATVTVLTIALSRIYLGVHWISDIAAGLTIGAVWVITCTMLYEVFRRLRMVRAGRSNLVATE